MHWIQVKHYSDSKFQRLVGVKRITFNKMLELVEQTFDARASKRGRPSRLCLADQLLMMLMYYREYRSIFHISTTYNISEVQTWRIIRKMEDILIGSKAFSLPGKKKLVENHFEVVLIDVGESPIERPKKNSASITLARKKDIP